MNSREAIFASIRRSLAVSGDEAPRRFEVETRLKEAPPGVIPKRGQGDVAARLATFMAEAERAQASVVEVADWADAPAEIARFLRDNNCPATLRMGADPRLAAMPWDATALEILHGASDGRDVNALSAALRRDRGDRHARARLGRRQPDDPQFPSRQPHRCAGARRHPRRL